MICWGWCEVDSGGTRGAEWRVIVSWRVHTSAIYISWGFVRSLPPLGIEPQALWNHCHLATTPQDTNFITADTKDSILRASAYLHILKRTNNSASTMDEVHVSIYGKRFRFSPFFLSYDEMLNRFRPRKQIITVIYISHKILTLAHIPNDLTNGHTYMRRYEYFRTDIKSTIQNI